jgi:hypothetical protein
MKRTLILSFLLINLISYSGGFRWPNVEYDHARLFLFNIKFESPSKLDYHIYNNGVYARSKVGTGYLLSKESLDDLHGAMVRGVDELVHGLSKCFIPRHGIIYYDKFGNPLASFTACFECEKIDYWSIKPLPKWNTDFEHFNLDKADKQIQKMLSILKQNDIPTYEHENEYQIHLEKDTTLKDVGEMFIKSNTLDSLYFKHYSISDVKTWVIKQGYYAELNETEETKISAGGDKWTYKELNTKEELNRFVFSFDEEDPFLVEATITHPTIILPNGVSVGMSIDNVIASIGIYDGIAFPAHIELKDKNLQLDYYFKNHTLYKIKASFSIV